MDDKDGHDGHDGEKPEGPWAGIFKFVEEQSKSDTGIEYGMVFEKIREVFGEKMSVDEINKEIIAPLDQFANDPEQFLSAIGAKMDEFKDDHEDMEGPLDGLMDMLKNKFPEGSDVTAADIGGYIMEQLSELNLPSDVMGEIQNEINGGTDLESFMKIIMKYAKQMHGGDDHHGGKMTMSRKEFIDMIGSDLDEKFGSVWSEANPEGEII
jgi:hypothetical protein